MNVIDAILTRNAQGKLGLPAPDKSALDKAFACALRAPDHQVLRPWRYLVIQGEGLPRLAELYIEASRAVEPDIEPEKIEKLRKMPLRAPMIVVAITAFKDDPKVPREEQLLSSGAGIQNFILALHDLGFTSMWRTGPLTENPGVKNGLGLAENEHISGFVYVGTPTSDAKKIVHPPLADFVSEWK
ncbi:MAG: nitroreductase family protein [Moraxellaceae bacterium]